MMLSLAFVTAGLAALSAVHAAPLAVRSSKAPYKPNTLDTTILQFALTLEHLEATFYAEGLAAFDEAAFESAGYGPEVRQAIYETGSEEAVHVATLTSVIGKGATKACKYDFGFNTVDEFLAISSILEGVGVSAYLGAAPLISSKAYLAAAGAILTVEARHQAVISEFQGVDGVPGPFDTALDIDQVWSLASPFITSCPKTNPKLPVVAFPQLNLVGSTTAGSSLQLNFKPQKGQKSYFAHFINGLTVDTIKINSHNQVKVPAGLQGRVYVVVTNCDILGDAGTVAGPSFFEAGFNNSA